MSKGWVRNVHPKGESSMVVSGLDVYIVNTLANSFRAE